jgi:hypothetical protein
MGMGVHCVGRIPDSQARSPEFTPSTSAPQSLIYKITYLTEKIKNFFRNIKPENVI